MSFAAKIAGLLNAAGTIDPSFGGAPAGVVLPFAGAAAPAGWLLCGGQEVSRTTYAALYAAIGTTYGAGDGSTTFNLPDCRERILAGKGDMGGASASNRLQRSKTVNFTSGNPVISGIVNTGNLHVGMQAYHASIPAGTTILSIDSASQVTLSAAPTANGTSQVVRFCVLDVNTLGSSGGAAQVMLAASEMPAHTHTGVTASAGAHTHTGGATAAQQGTVENSAGASASGTTGSAGAHTHTLTIDSAGGGNAHSNVQPTMVLNYIIKT